MWNNINIRKIYTGASCSYNMKHTVCHWIIAFETDWAPQSGLQTKPAAALWQVFCQSHVSNKHRQQAVTETHVTHWDVWESRHQMKHQTGNSFSACVTFSDWTLLEDTGQKPADLSQVKLFPVRPPFPFCLSHTSDWTCLHAACAHHDSSCVSVQTAADVSYMFSQALCHRVNQKELLLKSL